MKGDLNMDKWSLNALINKAKAVNKLDFIKTKSKGKSVLDLGCVRHSADFALSDPNWLHKHIGLVASRVVGVDYLQKDVDILRERGYNVVYGDVTAQLAIHEKFDLIIAGDLIEHLSNFDGFIKNLKNLLKEDGRIIISTPNPFYIDLFFFVSLKRSYIINPEHTCWIDPQALSQLLQRFDFVIDEINFIKPSWNFVNLITYSKTNEYNILLSKWENQSLVFRLYRLIAGILLVPLWYFFKLLMPLNSKMTSCSDYIVVIKNSRSQQ